jgi:hypothetical protein
VVRHQWFIVVTRMLKDEARAKELINRWHSQA